MKPGLLSSSLFLRIAAVIGASGVVLGALGAHALTDRLEAREMLSFWETAVLYHLVHALAILAVAIFLNSPRAASLRVALSGFFWTLGVLCFSGSIYVLALGGPGAIFGPITPLGGLFFIAGWILLIFWPGRPQPVSGS